jgi:starch synthase
MIHAKPHLVAARPRFTVALVDWTQLLEDFLDSVGVSFQAYREEMVGSWVFGYIAALRRAGVRTVLYAVSARVAVPTRVTHRPTGATICVLPASPAYRAARRHILDPYAGSVEEAVGIVHGPRRLLFAALKAVIPYLATPLRHLGRQVRRDRCDVILCQDYEHARFDLCLLLGRFLRLPVFATFQGGDTSISRLEQLPRPYALRAATGLIVATRSEAERIRVRYGVQPARIARVFNPLDLTQWFREGRAEARAELGIPETARVLAWHGRVQVQIKGLDLLMEVWERVCRDRPDRELRLLLIGSGSEAADLRQRMDAWRVRNIVWVDRYIYDRAVLRRYLSAADIYTLTSRREGFPVAPVEAMACGLPVIAFDAPGMPDILEGGEASGGLVVPRGDVDALASALGRALDDAAWSRTLGKRARARAQSHFSLEAVGEQLRAFLVRRGDRVGNDLEPKLHERGRRNGRIHA